MPRPSSKPPPPPREGTKRSRTQFVTDDPSLSPEENKRRRAEANKDKPTASTQMDFESMHQQTVDARKQALAKSKAAATVAESAPTVRPHRRRVSRPQ